MKPNIILTYITEEAKVLGLLVPPVLRPWGGGKTFLDPGQARPTCLLGYAAGPLQKFPPLARAVGVLQLLEVQHFLPQPRHLAEARDGRFRNSRGSGAGS